MKAAIAHTLWDRGTCQYPFNRSNLFTNFAVHTWSMQSSILEKRNQVSDIIQLTKIRTETRHTV